MTPDVLVIGVGNAFRGDDAVGIAAARRLAQLGLEGVRVVEAGGDGVQLMGLWEPVPAVILIDAVHGAGRPGTIHRIDAGAGGIAAWWSRGSTHAFSVGEAVELARALGRLPRRLVVYGVTGAQFQAGDGLSPQVEAALDPLARRITAETRAIWMAHRSRAPHA